MEINHDTRNLSGCGKPLKACGVVAALAVLSLIGLLLLTARMPAVRNLMKCRANMIEIGEALRRYNDRNDSYPSDLSIIKQEYLKNPSVLRCPLDKSPGDEPSYIYHRPPTDAPDDFVVLECDRHRLRRDMPPSRLQLLKGGTLKVQNRVGFEPAEKGI